MTKKTPVLDDLDTVIEWNQRHGQKGDPYDDPFIQFQLRTRLEALFERYNIPQPGLLGDKTPWPLIRPVGTHKGIAPVDPFFQLAVMLAFQYVHGFRIVSEKKKPGRKKKINYTDADLRWLGWRIAEGKKLPAKKSAATIIRFEVNNSKSPFYGMEIATLKRAFKKFLANMFADRERNLKLLPLYYETKKRKTILKEKIRHIKKMSVVARP